ncbi:MFS transporter [Nocardia anaemiae]|uniref:MFS transporter n=1 Tax=Nocardia anaemiae TaxID=263910 RepID=UPI000A03A435|nr:MFS transporter [Nocardia anaemiae]
MHKTSELRPTLEPTPDRRRWLALVVLLVAGFMDLLDVTIVNVALPTIQSDLNAPYADLEWVVSGYLLGFAAMLITGGRLGDLIGRKTILLVGLTLFTLASLACGIAPGPAWLIAARIVQGATAGLMIPQILAIMHVSFPAAERGKVFGIWGGVLGSASVAGLIVGGILVQANLFGWAWRPIFLVNVPVGMLAIPAAMMLVRQSRSATADRLDPLGTVLAIAAVLLLVYPLTEGRTLGWPVWTFALMAAAALLLAVFVAYERRRSATVGSPLVVLNLFRERTFSAGMAVWLLFWIALGGYFLVWTLYLQAGLGWTPLRAGLSAAPFAVAAAAGAGTSVQVFVPRYGRMVLFAGAMINAAGFGLYLYLAAHYGSGITSAQMLAPLAISGFGFGLFAAPTVDLILSGVPGHDAGSASGQLSTIQQVGMALGVALAGVFFFTQLDNTSDHGTTAAIPTLQQRLTDLDIPATARDQIRKQFRACVHARSAATDPTAIPSSCQPAPGQPDPLAQVLTEAGLEANAHNMSHTFAQTLWWAIGILIAVAAGVFALPRRLRDDRPRGREHRFVHCARLHWWLRPLN